MKKFIHKISHFALFIGLLLTMIEASAQDNFYTVSGTVRDELTRKPLESASISAIGSNIGTVSNADGYFVLKIPRTANVKAIEISYIGYRSTRIPFQNANIIDQTISLPVFTNVITEVEIKGWDARYLVQEAMGKIAENYPANPTVLTGFYRETIQKKRNYINISEAVVDVYKTSYAYGIQQDRLQVLKGRKLLSQRRNDTLSVKLVGGPHLAIFVDIVKYPDFLLNAEMLSVYRFRMEDMTQINGRIQYIVAFEPLYADDPPLYIGRFYIDKETLSFSRAEFQLDMSSPVKVADLILRKKPLTLRFKPEALSYVISYQERDGKSYLSYIRNELEFQCDWRKKLFSTNYRIVSEMVITDIQTESAAPIARKDVFSQNQSLSEEAMAFYDDNFWGSYNIIEPTESLESAVNRLKRQRE